LLLFLLRFLLPFAKAFYYFSIYLHFPRLTQKVKKKIKEICMIYYSNALMSDSFNLFNVCSKFYKPH